MPFEFITLKAMGDIAVVTLNRPDKRNAIHEALLVELDTFFSKLPITAKAVVLTGNGPHFCAALEFMHMCQAWHRVFDKIQYGGIPVVGALHGAVVGGGLELAAATHIRVADPSTYFALPEVQKGIFTGGGATMRVARIISPSRMVEMMLTGRGAESGLGTRNIGARRRVKHSHCRGKASGQKCGTVQLRHSHFHQPDCRYVGHRWHVCRVTHGRGGSNWIRSAIASWHFCRQIAAKNYFVKKIAPRGDI
jgi:hypothetical protein